MPTGRFRRRAPASRRRTARYRRRPDLPRPTTRWTTTRRPRFLRRFRRRSRCRRSASAPMRRVRGRRPEPAGADFGGNRAQGSELPLKRARLPGKGVVDLSDTAGDSLSPRRELRALGREVCGALLQGGESARQLSDVRPRVGTSRQPGRRPRSRVRRCRRRASPFRRRACSSPVASEPAPVAASPSWSPSVLKPT